MEHLLDEVSSSLDRIRSQVVGKIQSQLDAVMSKGEGLVRRLEMELDQLTDRRATLEVQAISQDHIGFLQVTTDPSISTSHVAPGCQRDVAVCHLLRLTRRPQLLCRRITRRMWTRTSRSTSSWGT